MFGFIFLLLQYLKELLGYSPSCARVGLVPWRLWRWWFRPQLAHRYGIRLVVGLGMAMIATGLGMMAGSIEEAGYWPVLARIALLGAGIVFAATPAADAVVAALPSANLGVASALYDLTRELGGSAGRRGPGQRVQQRPSHRNRESDPGLARRCGRYSFAGALHVAEHLSGRRSAALADAAGDALGSGMNAALLIGVAVVLVGGGVAVALLPPRPQELSDERATRETQ